MRIIHPARISPLLSIKVDHMFPKPYKPRKGCCKPREVDICSSCKTTPGIFRPGSYPRGNVWDRDPSNFLNLFPDKYPFNFFTATILDTGCITNGQSEILKENQVVWCKCKCVTLVCLPTIMKSWGSSCCLFHFLLLNLHPSLVSMLGNSVGQCLILEFKSLT